LEKWILSFNIYENLEEKECARLSISGGENVLHPPEHTCIGLLHCRVVIIDRDTGTVSIYLCRLVEASQP